MLPKARVPFTSITEPVAVTTDQYFKIWQAYSDLVGDIATGIIRLATIFETAHDPLPVMAPIMLVV
ncbi:hypothetical protein [Paenibacillus pinihumi]|uniref:hypothetical protein n=1 Tax=Paenibacillus pinihumi TaxID=669462 RepID=UPI00040661BB